MGSVQNDEVNKPLLEPPSEEASSELEEILSDASLSWWRRFLKAVAVEFRFLFRLAAPAVIVYLLNNVTSMSTQIFCGHLGNLELAASSLGNNGIQLLAYGLMIIPYVAPDELQTENANLQTELDQAKSDLTLLKKRMAFFKEELKKDTKFIQTYEERDELRTRTKELDAELKSCRSESAILRTSCAELERSVKSKEALLESVKARHDNRANELTNQLRGYNLELADLRHQVRQYERLATHLGLWTQREIGDLVVSLTCEGNQEQLDELLTFQDDVSNWPKRTGGSILDAYKESRRVAGEDTSRKSSELPSARKSHKGKEASGSGPPTIVEPVCRLDDPCAGGGELADYVVKEEPVSDEEVDLAELLSSEPLSRTKHLRTRSRQPGPSEQQSRRTVRHRRKETGSSSRQTRTVLNPTEEAFLKGLFSG